MQFIAYGHGDLTYRCGHVVHSEWTCCTEQEKASHLFCPECQAKQPDLAMTLDQIKAFLKQAGFTLMKTHGGLIRLSEWDPYGMTTVNKHPSNRAYRGTVVGRGNRLYVADSPRGWSVNDQRFLLGLWEPI